MTRTLKGMAQLSPAVDGALRGMVDDYRARCLWFLRRDYSPTTLEEGLRVLAAIDRQGDVEAFRRAAEVRRWLSPSSSATSAER